MTGFLKTVESYRPGAYTMPGRHYTAPEILALEHERVFARHWISVGRTAEFTRRGDYRLVGVAGESLIVLRDQQGTLRAFFNICRHRGTRLCDATHGHLSETIQCPYHAWTYVLDGRLIGAPYMNEVPGFDKQDYPLHAAATAEWEGLCSCAWRASRDRSPSASRRSWNGSDTSTCRPWSRCAAANTRCGPTGN
jgi:phenylpropionate dioxygenase-like ring-hydroxylating dioxygenase large terminal subunit